MKVGCLTGGGDCPGLNAVIRAVVRKALLENIEVVGIRNGWKGLIQLDVIPLNQRAVSGILPKGGTILGTSRTNPFKDEKQVRQCEESMKTLGLDAMIVIGGEDTLGVAAKFSERGRNMIGVPKTIDNDIAATDFTFGFDTAVNIAMEAIDRLHTTAESHHRVMVVEAMGRHAGWIAVYAGLAGGADMILIPEKEIDLEYACEALKRRHSQGKDFSIVVVAEGAKFRKEDLVTQQDKLDEFGHVRLGGIAHILGEKIQEKTGFETRVTVLGHVQRGGSPTAFDRVLGTRFGIEAVKLVTQKKFGYMVSLQGNKIVSVPLKEIARGLKTVDLEFYEIAKVFFG
ncbi:MAG: ATP-dependent 6-phosphofructokinase [Candidatus Omnitrophota bacterium]